jgi:RNA polymerase sigma factor, sigma-70 family
VLVTRYQSLVRGCVQRYRDSPEPVEDLMQAGYVGLLKAINNFDPVLGQNLAAYAQPCVSGEIKRHFRDKRWQITSSGQHRNCCCRSAGRAANSLRSWAALPGTRRWRVTWA